MITKYHCTPDHEYLLVLSHVLCFLFRCMICLAKVCTLAMINGVFGVTSSVMKAMTCSISIGKKRRFLVCCAQLYGMGNFCKINYLRILV